MAETTENIPTCPWCGERVKLGKRPKSFCNSSCRGQYSKAKKRQKELEDFFDQIEAELHRLRERVLSEFPMK